MKTRSVRVENLSPLAGEREVHEFFSFSGEIDSLDLYRDSSGSHVAFVTFKDPSALDIALQLSGARIIDQIVRITPIEGYVPHLDNALKPAASTAPTTSSVSAPTSAGVYVNKAQDAVTIMLAKGSALRQDALNKAKAFDERHQLTASASARVMSFDHRVGLSDKLSVGIATVNEKMRSVDKKYNVSDKTMAAITTAERKLSDTGSAVKSSRYVSVGASWLGDALNKVSKAGHVAGAKTLQKFQSAMSNLTSKESPVSA